MKKKTIEERVRGRKLRLPEKWLVKVVLFIFKLLTKKNNVEYIYHYNVEDYQDKQVILLGQHAAHDDFMWAPLGFKGKTPNYICGMFHFYYPTQRKLLTRVGAIPKYLYQTDFFAMKEIDKIINMGGSIAIFPEGIQSTSGSNHPINPSTLKFLVKYKLPVILYKSFGGYLTNPRFSKDRRNGKIICSYELLFTPEDYQKYNVEELYHKLMDKFAYNDFDYNKNARIPFVGKEPNATGLDKILYKCPRCHSEFKLKVVADALVCKECGNQVVVNEYYDLMPLANSKAFPSIDAWYKWQRETIKEEVKNPSFHMRSKCIILGIEKHKAKKNPEVRLGEGEIVLKPEGLYFDGQMNHQDSHLFFKIELMPSIPFTPGKNIDMHYQNEYFGFEPISDKNQVVKWMIAAEELHNLRDEKWGKVSEDAYNSTNKRR